MKKTPNPNGNKFVLPKGYTDLGWQLDFNASELKKCREAGHIRRKFDNSKYLYRCNDVVYICDQCKNVHHVDMSD